MVIKVSTLLTHNTSVIVDTNPTLGGPLNVNNFPIENSGSPVTITGNEYPLTSGAAGQVLTTNGFGITSWQNPIAGPITLIGDVTGSGLSPVTTTLSDSGVVASTYGSSNTVGVFSVNSKGRITAASNAPIVITPANAGLGFVTNALQVINAGGAPSIQEGTGAPSGAAIIGALYVDQANTNGNGIWRYNGTSWDVIAKNLSLYSESTSVFVAPIASGANSIALGDGAQTEASAVDSLAIGNQSLARTQGSVVQASGRFASTGDAQTGRYLMRSHTINALPVELFINGTAGGVRLVLPDDSTWTFKVTITGHRTDASNGHAGYTAAGVIYRASGASTTAIQGSVQKTVLAESNQSWDINISADPTYGSLKITVTGEAGKTIRWVALVETVEVTN